MHSSVRKDHVCSYSVSFKCVMTDIHRFHTVVSQLIETSKSFLKYTETTTWKNNFRDECTQEVTAHVKTHLFCPSSSNNNGISRSSSVAVVVSPRQTLLAIETS